MILAVDAMGGDKAPTVVLDGVRIAAKRLPDDVEFLLVGHEDVLRDAAGPNGLPPRSVVVHAPDSIDMHAISDRFSPEEAAVAAIEAGADFVVDGFNLMEREEHPAPSLAAALQSELTPQRIERSLARLQQLRAEITQV